MSEDLCSDCPPFGYPTDATRCVPCPRRPAPAPVAEPAIRKLEWRTTIGQDCIASAGFGGRYSIQFYAGMKTPAKLETQGWYEGSPAGMYDSIEAAKAAAQADYEARIRAALVPAVTAEPVAWMSAYHDQPGLFENATTSAITADDWRRYGRTVIPLYAVPASSERERRLEEALARLVDSWAYEDRMHAKALLSEAPCKS